VRLQRHHQHASPAIRLRRCVAGTLPWVEGSAGEGKRAGTAAGSSNKLL
jgi:hypothetical protein